MMSTVVVQLTGTGRGAVASLLVAGPTAVSVVQKRFQRRSGRSGNFIRDQTYFGEWQSAGYEEELVVCQTADEQIEIHCHGGSLASKKIIESLVADGITAITHEQWLNRSETNAHRRIARQRLANARTERTASILLDQVRGAVEIGLKQIHDLIVREDTFEAMKLVERLIACGRLGQRIHEPFSVVLIGKPNAGKSSLVNSLVGYQRAIVYDQPGTTRDLVSVETALDGWPLVFIDTAGIRESRDVIEQEGIRRARATLHAADLVLQIIDMSSPADAAEDSSFEDIDDLASPRIRVGTKADLVNHAVGSFDATVDIRTSAVTGDGINELQTAIAAKLVPAPPKSGEAVPLTGHLTDRLISLQNQLKTGDLTASVATLKAMQSIDLLESAGNSKTGTQHKTDTI